MALRGVSMGEFDALSVFVGKWSMRRRVTHRNQDNAVFFMRDSAIAKFTPIRKHASLAAHKCSLKPVWLKYTERGKLFRRWQRTRAPSKWARSQSHTYHVIDATTADVYFDERTPGTLP